MYGEGTSIHARLSTPVNYHIRTGLVETIIDRHFLVNSADNYNQIDDMNVCDMVYCKILPTRQLHKYQIFNIINLAHKKKSWILGFTSVNAELSLRFCEQNSTRLIQRRTSQAVVSKYPDVVIDPYIIIEKRVYIDCVILFYTYSYYRFY